MYLELRQFFCFLEQISLSFAKFLSSNPFTFLYCHHEVVLPRAFQVVSYLDFECMPRWHNIGTSCITGRQIQMAASINGGIHNLATLTLVVLTTGTGDIHSRRSRTGAPEFKYHQI